MTRILLILTLAAVKLLLPVPECVSSTEFSWMRMLTYSFFHASWLHLAVNCLAIWAVFRERSSIAELITAYVVAVLVCPCSAIPVVGMSNLLYAVIGMRMPELSDPRWKRPPTIIFLAVTLAMFFFPQLSALTHTISFVIGLLIAGAVRFIRRLYDDSRRYS